MNWLQVLLDYFRALLPLTKLHAWERGVRMTYVPWDLNIRRSLRERKIITIPARTIIDSLGPGLHLLLPFFQDFRKESTVPQVMDVLVQSITTKDGKSVSFSVNIEYEIVDADANILLVHNFEHSMEALSRIHLARRVREFSLEELLSKQTWLEQSLSGTLTTRAKKWGAKINDVGFTDLVQARAFRFFGDAAWKGDIGV